jgi:hypothetical protein
MFRRRQGEFGGPRKEPDSGSVRRGASFKTKDQLREAIEAFIRRHSERAKPFRWRKREVKGSHLQNTIINLRN